MKFLLNFTLQDIRHSHGPASQTSKKNSLIIEPRHEKTCLREFPTRSDSNCSATEASRRLESLATETRDITLSRQPITKALIDCAEVQADLLLCCSHMT